MSPELLLPCLAIAHRSIWNEVVGLRLARPDGVYFRASYTATASLVDWHRSYTFRVSSFDHGSPLDALQLGYVSDVSGLFGNGRSRDVLGPTGGVGWAFARPRALGLLSCSHLRGSGSACIGGSTPGEGRQGDAAWYG